MHFIILYIAEFTLRKLFIKNTFLMSKAGWFLRLFSEISPFFAILTRKRVNETKIDSNLMKSMVHCIDIIGS